MKRFTIFLLAVLLIVALAVPAFASDTDYALHPIWEYVKTNYPSKEDVIIYTAQSGATYLYAGIASDYLSNGDSIGMAVFVCYKITGDSYEFIKQGDGLDINVINKLSIWTNFDIYTDSTRTEVYHTSDYSPKCDGSICPANDANVDGICDDCGMVLSLRSLTYPAFPEVTGENKHTALVKTKYNGVDAYMYSVFYSDSGYDIAGHAYGTVYQISVVDSAHYRQFVTTDGQTWVMIQDGSVNNQDVGSGIIADTTLVDSTFTWYDSNGDPFFPFPLWMEMGQLTEGELGTLTTETAGTMKVLAVCGVGLIALLVVLSLFGKRLLIFRN